MFETWKKNKLTDERNGKFRKYYQEKYYQEAASAKQSLTEKRDELRVKLYRFYLNIYSRDQSSLKWANIQYNLGNALVDQVASSQGGTAKELLTEVIKAYRLALEVFSRDQFPLKWAKIQYNLGAALRKQAASSQGNDASQLLAEAVKAYRLALEVYTRDQFPQQWAMTQHNLLIALKAQKSDLK
ncbi:MAG: hypothetical protein K0U68_04495 [Gammaproteobacteria bacterium]|nr:hypothetical protein [Gammaproteobacteria bacterium]